ncbi:hypothetical protein GCM10010306_057730 [Streptomyces umbrinus]|nr:hypothetical protein GCM10010306_057730 [Streptomyces umbrinus]
MALAVIPISRAMARRVMASGPPEAINSSATSLISAVVSARSRSRRPVLPALLAPATRALYSVTELMAV